MNIPVLQILDSLTVNERQIADAEKRTYLNEVVADYCLRLYEDKNEQALLAASERLLNCSKVWCCDDYVESHVTDITFVAHCRSRFCLHCQKLRQASNLSKFVPLLVDVAENYDLYLAEFTIPNIPGHRIHSSAKLMAQAFKRLIRFLNGRDKIAGIDFSKYGFYAALRTFEITYKVAVSKTGELYNDYHPHYHVIFALKKGLVLEKNIVNDFSYNYGVLENKFSEFEVLIQKLWYLLVESERTKLYAYEDTIRKLGSPLSKNSFIAKLFPNGAKRSRTGGKGKKGSNITKQAIEALELGYSCMFDKIAEDDANNLKQFCEVFKYAFKVTSEDSELFSYEQFVELYYGLRGVRTTQGYGAWYNLKLDEEDDTLNEFYPILVAFLRSKETPYSVKLELSDVAERVKNRSTVFITKKNLNRWFRQLSEDDKRILKSEMGDVTPYTPLFENKTFYITDLAKAYYRYLEVRRTSPLFADVREKQARAEAEKKPLKLTVEQLSFLESIF